MYGSVSNRHVLRKRTASEMRGEDMTETVLDNSDEISNPGAELGDRSQEQLQNFQQSLQDINNMDSV